MGGRGGAGGRGETYRPSAVLLSGLKLLPIARCTDSITGLRSASLWFGFRKRALPPLLVLVTLKGIHSPNDRLRQDFQGKGFSSGGEGIGRGVGRARGRFGWPFSEGAGHWVGESLMGEESIRVVIWGRVKGFSGII